MRIKDIEACYRPREKAIRYGINSLETSELLALIIGSGVKNISALDIARNILNDFPLSSFQDIDYQILKKQKGLNTATICRFLAALELHKRLNNINNHSLEKVLSSADIEKMYFHELRNLTHEVIILVMLNYHNNIIHEEIITKGNTTSSAIELTELLKMLLTYNTKKFYIIHNHPLGNPFPSDADLSTTYELLKSTKNIGIKLVDHIIFGKDNYYSFKDNALI